MATANGPNETGKTSPETGGASPIRDSDLERRRRELDASLAERIPASKRDTKDRATGSAAGYGQAMKLSSEFIAGIAVGAGLGWAIDRLAGTSPWGLVVFLLLGFLAGILNVLRSVGLVAESGLRPSGKDGEKPGSK